MADVAQRKARDAERARRYRAKRKAAAEEKEERAKRQRLEDYEELKVSFMYFFVDITFVPDLLSLSLFLCTLKTTTITARCLT